MKITVIGAGKVGRTLCEQLCGEGHDVTAIDLSDELLSTLDSRLDIQCVSGNAASKKVQIEAGVPGSDLTIAVTASDEINILCCLLSKKLGACSTIARVRNPEYAEQLSFLRDDLGLSMTVNPELAAAEEISRTLRIPSAIKVDSFAKGRVEMIEWRVAKDSPLCGTRLFELYAKYRFKILICAVKRGDGVYIPTGDFMLEGGDIIFITASPKNIERFFATVGVSNKRIKHVMIVGGGKIAYYLAKQLNAAGMKTKIIERDANRCRALCVQLPNSTVICGDGLSQDILEEEGIADADAFITLTDIDELNIIAAMFAGKRGVKKVVAKVTRAPFGEIIADSGIETTVSPKEVTANQIVQYVRAMRNSLHSNVETLYKLFNGSLEALEFRVIDELPFLGMTLKDLNLKPNILIAAINRDNTVIIPGGSDSIRLGDSVIVVTTHSKLNDISDIIA